MSSSFCSLVRQALNHGSLYFAGLLADKDVESAFGPPRSSATTYSTLNTINVFLTQCLSADHSCIEAVAKFNAWRLSQGLPECSPESGGYCVARDKLSEQGCFDLARNVGQELDNAAPEQWLWKGRRAYVLDGSVISMPGTAELLEEYPQESQQRPGAGYPLARILVLFSLAVGAAIEVMIKPYQGKLTSETSMLRQLLQFILPGAVIIGDRAYSGWFDMALCIAQKLDFVIRMNASRNTDFRTGKRLSKDDHIIKLKRPSTRPPWMSVEQYQALPHEIGLREVRIRIAVKGFRTKVIIVHTTLLDADAYTKDDIADAFRQRWNAELNLRHLKTTLQMDHLRCKNPHRVRNEFYMHILAYNLIRKVMALAAVRSVIKPWHVSFKGAIQTLSSYLTILTCHIDLTRWCDSVLQSIASHRVGNRPDRFEPRVVKRRPKNYPRMIKRRQEYKHEAA